MKKSIITFVILILTVDAIEAKGGSVAGGIIGYTAGYNMTRAMGSNNRGRSASYYDKKIRAKERRNEKLQETIEDTVDELKRVQRELKEVKRHNRDTE